MRILILLGNFSAFSSIPKLVAPLSVQIHSGLSTVEITYIQVYNITFRMHFLPSLKGPGFSSTSPARMSSMASIGTIKFGEISERCSVPVLRRLSIDSNFSDATRRRTDTRRTGGKM